MGNQVRQGHYTLLGSRRPYQLSNPCPGPTLAPQKEGGEDKDDMQSCPTLEDVTQRINTTCCYLPSEWEEGDCGLWLVPGWFWLRSWSPHHPLWFPTPAGEDTEPAGPELQAPHTVPSVLPIYPLGPSGQVAGEQKRVSESVKGREDSGAVVTNTCVHRDTS